MIGEFIVGILIQLVQEIIKAILVPFLRFPGALLGWIIWRGRSFGSVRRQGYGFQQARVGLAINLLMTLIWGFIFHR